MRARPGVLAPRGALARWLDLVRVDDIGRHDARTLASWRANLTTHRPRVVALRGERFLRTWWFYLSYCEAGFAERYLGDVQMLFRCA